MRILMDPSLHPIILTKASKEDIPSLIRIHLAAFAFDNAARLMSRDDEEMLRKQLDSEMSKPTAIAIKAIDKDTGDILGWIGFVKVGYPDLKIEEEGAETDGNDNDSGTALRRLIQDDYFRVRAEWMSNKKYIHVGNLVTDPPHQGRGIGSALTRCATCQADDDGVPCWIGSTSVAHDLYYRFGFRDVGRLEVDLRDFAPGGQTGKRGWGAWESFYMLRLPATSM